ncbi:mitochondrial import inner membrane translocase subunit Tim23-like [Cervus canadensis]|uniref:mitochondrial import inner membrane translocase subunit Tim23-like n=1 Tax=Cervus canadensis TaxID=1574408 RepID=UPI001C9E8EA9|nr:mitochondrial import inner membrane translocase subunit Tim23-like [Cervus canadensis]
MQCISCAIIVINIVIFPKGIKNYYYVIFLEREHFKWPKRAPGRSACEGAGGNAGLPAVTEERRPSRLSWPEAAGRSRRAHCCDTMEGGGGSGNKTTGGLAGFFGAGGAGYSHAGLAGIPLTGMNPLSPYINVDPRYLVQDTDEFILPTGANKTRGRFELAFFTIGGCCMTGAAFGAMNGLRLGLKETQNMAWSKARNVQILNMVTRQGALWANTLGSLALLYSAFGVIIEKTRGAEDDLNTVAAGTMTGMLYKCTGGLRGVARGGLAGLTLTSLYALYNNWEHMKGSLLQQSL